MLELYRKYNIQKILTPLITVLFFLSVLRGFYIAGNQISNNAIHKTSQHEEFSMRPLNAQWTLHHENGSTELISLPYTLSTKEEKVSITKNISGLFHQGDIIQFDNLRQGMIVSVDNHPVYKVNTTVLQKQLIFTDYQLVTIPSQKSASILKIDFVYKLDGNYDIPSIEYGSYDAAASRILSNDTATMLILFVFMMIFMAVFMIYAYCKIHHMSYSAILDLGAFIFTAYLWGFTDSYLPTLLPIPQEVIGIICYLSIMAVPLPMCQFVWRSCKKQHKIFEYLFIAGSINLLLQMIGSTFGVIQLQDTFYVAHILILAVTVASLVCVYKSRKALKSTEMDILYFGILILAGVSAISVFSYWQKGDMHYRLWMLTGILIFSIILFCYVIFYYMKIAQNHRLKLSEAQIHERLSLYDELTGLPNRRAFEKKMDELESKIESLEDAVLIMMDVNGLKMVNDQYGHAAGDDLIVRASKVIYMTYKEKGFCYRIGGDEFVVIIEDFSIPLSNLSHDFEKNIAEINTSSRWKVSIAQGLSHLTHPNGQKLTISDWKQEADVNMYRDKLAMTGGRTRDRAQDLRDIIRCIIGTVEAKDVYTAAHSERVRELSFSIASNLGVSPYTMQNIETAANLHDIGKIGIPDRVLLKPGKLDANEYEIMKGHTIIGSDIIKQAKGMQEIANIVLHHHERWDGKGYPDGLHQDEIPLESRVIALADSIDAMTSRRVYHECMSLDECRIEIEKNAGIIYDPAITQIVLQNWNDIVDIVLLHPKRLINDQSL